ncbi:MAG: thermonuclease family protein [Alphaproteobacteria bacterium]|nr:thermonuclease family protein [Alphaproteobacteria bacterium]
MHRLLHAFMLILIATAAAAEIKGQPVVISGDLIEIEGEQIRLYGIDAPELEQTCKTRRGTPHACGKIARQVLRELIAGQEVTCEGDKRDEDGRRLAVCSVGRFDLNKQMVLQGWALADRQQSQAYVRAEAAAQQLREGLWKRTFVPPRAWREAQRKQKKSSDRQFVIEIDGSVSVRFSGECELKTRSGTKTLTFDGRVPQTHTLAGLGLSCKFSKGQSKGMLAIVAKEGNAVISRSMTSGSGVIAFSIQ